MLWLRIHTNKIGSEVKPRPYQQVAIDNTLNAFKSHSSALVVMATGTGKTPFFSTMAAMQKQRVMVMAHTTELVEQAAEKIAAVVGEHPDIEMASRRADTSIFGRSKCVVTSVQTQSNGRMKRFDPNHFDLLVVDEAHHAGSGSYQEVIKHYQRNKNLKVLGVTATPSRCAGVFQTTAFQYQIIDAINDGWLVPIKQKFVEVGSLDYSKVKTVAGDLSAIDLATVLDTEENLHGTVVPVLDIYDNRSTLVFCPTVAHAERMCEVFNRYEPGIAAFCSGETPRGERNEIVKHFRAGNIKILCNVGVFTEGFDAPKIGLVVMCRATKSPTLYEQQIGRGTRPLAGTVDGIEDSALRKQSILDSSKPYLEVLDFVGNSGRHRLCSLIDVLRPDLSDDVRRMAYEASKSGAGSIDDMIEMAEDAAEKIAAEAEAKRLRSIAKRERITARVNYCTESIDPFNRGRDLVSLASTFKPVSEGMMDILSRNGINGTNLNFESAKKMVQEIIIRQKRGMCSYKQANLLKKFGIDAENMTRDAANKAIDKLKANGWKR